jgi:phage tail-like protein
MSRIDPLLNHNFIISLLDSSSTLALIGSIASTTLLGNSAAGFSECSGIELTMQPEEYKEGGRNGAVLKFPSRVTWSNLTLKRGIAISTDLWDWHYGFVTGNGSRRDGTITLLDEQRQPNRIWYFSRGLPVKYSGAMLNATQNQVAVETVEIAHEGMYQVGGLGTVSGVIGAIAGLVG